MLDLAVGTSGYDYLDWREAFYPPDLPQKEFLAWYSRHFTTLELNATHYRIIPPAQWLALLDSCEGRLDFSLKAHESLTHRADRSDWDRAASDFLRSIEPLRRAGKLTAILLQFPESFTYEPENRAYLDRLLKRMHEWPLVVEFRHPEWLNDKVFRALRGRKVGFCCADGPVFAGSPAAMDLVTSDLAYIRFHGRSAVQSWGSDAPGRADYLYSEAELRGWVGRLKSLSQHARRIRVYFGNHLRAQSVRNGLTLQDMLVGEGIVGNRSLEEISVVGSTLFPLPHVPLVP